METEQIGYFLFTFQCKKYDIVGWTSEAQSGIVGGIHYAFPPYDCKQQYNFTLKPKLFS